MQVDTSRPRRPRSTSIGQPVEFVQGQFAGQTMRAELHELQKADLGRKYARKDRRPLDPPPIVQLRLFRVYNIDTDREVEEEIQNYDEVQSFGLLCHIDLFQVPTPPDPQGDGETDSSTPDQRSDRTKKKRIAKQSFYQMPVPAGPTSYNQAQLASTYPDSGSPSSLSLNVPPTSFLLPHAAFPPFAGTSISNTPYPDSEPEHPSRSSSISSSYSYAQADNEYDIVAYMGDYPLRESSKCTTAVAGATFVQANEVSRAGNKALMFVFSDLAVKREGTFVLRYRFLDILSRARGHPDLAVLAECYGGPFRVYSTKEFPGLSASTDLTKQVSYSGIRTNFRENERKRRKKSEILAAEAEAAAAAAAAAAIAEAEAEAESGSRSAAADTLGKQKAKGKGRARHEESYDRSSSELRHALDEDMDHY